MHCFLLSEKKKSGTSISLIASPVVSTKLRAMALHQSIQDLAARIDPSLFLEKFKAPVSELAQLVEANTVNIPRLLELLPPETLNPNPLVYNSPMYASGAICAIALLNNRAIVPFKTDQLERIHGPDEPKPGPDTDTNELKK